MAPLAMKPNIFEYRRYTAEDFFSLSLAYIATTFPSIGQKLVQRIAVLAGKPATFFGSFQSCTFVGHKVAKPHFTSSSHDSALVTSANNGADKPGNDARRPRSVKRTPSLS